MRVNQENKSVDMERRDVDYILPAYVRSYLFYSKNELPEKIVLPMFPSVLVQGKEIPIEYVLTQDAIAVEIAQDGADVAEVTEEQEAVIDEKDDRIKELKEELAVANKTLGEITAAEEYEAEHGNTPIRPEGSVSPARAAFAKEEDELKTEDPSVIETLNKSDHGQYPSDSEPTTTPPPTPSVDRQPKQPPGGDIGPGSALSDMQARDRRDQIRTAKDLMEEPDTNEAEEKAYEKPISRDEKGKPVVEEES